MVLLVLQICEDLDEGGRYQNLSSRGRELQGIRLEIEEYLLNSLTVRTDHIIEIGIFLIVFSNSRKMSTLHWEILHEEGKVDFTDLCLEFLNINDFIDCLFDVKVTNIFPELT